MKYRLYTLKFSTPVHFADSDFGGNLEKTSISCSADTYFNALCFEASRQSNELVEKIIDLFSHKKLQLSSLFPYHKDEKNDELELYLPKPYFNTDKLSEIDSYDAQKIYSNKLKKINKVPYIRASELKSWLHSLNTTNLSEITNPLFAVKRTDTKVFCRAEEAMPYFISSYHFNKNMGLYFILGFEDDLSIDLIEPLIESLGYSGIGAKKSSGYGKYEFDEDPLELDTESGIYKDDLSLAKMLNNDKSLLQLAIAPLIPMSKDLDRIRVDFSYRIIKRSGYIYDKNTHRKMRKNDIYMLAEGSLMRNRYKGLMLKEEYSNISYPIYRNGIGMFVGLD